MAKTDDIIKEELSNIGDYKNLKRRGFIGSSNYDQELWDDGGLTFSYDGKDYGSNDFAWYKKEKWINPASGKENDCKPVLVVEGTHCLNTNSYGTAQIQRFHHAYGPFMNGLIGVYYMREGKHPIRHDLLLAVYNANIIHKYKENRCAYLITNDIKDVEKLVHLIGDYGEKSDEVFDFVDEVLRKMKSGFNSFYNKQILQKKIGEYEDYLNERCIFKYDNNFLSVDSKINAGQKWIKFLGPKKDSFLDSSIRYGHIVLGEAFVAKYLLQGEGLLSENDNFVYYFPLISKKELAEINKTLTHDKEWLILYNNKSWQIKCYDEIDFDDKKIKPSILPFKNKNLNNCRKEWNVVRKKIEEALKKGKFNIL